MVRGLHEDSGHYGVLGSENYGVLGYGATESGVLGIGQYEASGVEGRSDNLFGVIGMTNTISIGVGVVGKHISFDNVGLLGTVTQGVMGLHADSDNVGYLGTEKNGVRGIHRNSGN